MANYAPVPDALMLVGQARGQHASLVFRLLIFNKLRLDPPVQVGLVLLIIEAGLEIDVATLRQTGLRGLATSLSSTIFGTLPIGFGLAKARSRRLVDTRRPRYSRWHTSSECPTDARFCRLSA